MVGSRLGHYEITAHLGSGGMGDVFQATDTKLGRSVSIKFLPEAILPDGRLLFIQRGEGEDDITQYNVVLNWFTELRSKMARASDGGGNR
jgi:serine/threonine protein kinase